MVTNVLMLPTYLNINALQKEGKHPWINKPPFTPRTLSCSAFLRSPCVMINTLVALKQTKHDILFPPL